MEIQCFDKYCGEYAVLVVEMFIATSISKTTISDNICTRNQRCDVMYKASVQYYSHWKKDPANVITDLELLL